MKTTKSCMMTDTRRTDGAGGLLRRGFAAILVIAMLFCCACRVDNGGVVATDVPATQEPTQEPINVGGRLSMPMPQNLHVTNPDYNPLTVHTEEMLNLFSLVYDKLIEIDETNMLVPSLAQSWVRDESTPNAWIINLRKDVRWHSGALLTAADVIYTYNTLYMLGNESYYSSALRSIVSMEVIDDSTLRCTMNGPGMLELYALNFPIIKENAGWLVGTGAYRAASVSDERITLTANDDWWDRPPYISTVEFLARDNNDTALASYSAGQLNFVPTAQLTVGQYNEPGTTNVSDVMTQGMEAIFINHTHGIMQDKRFRQAIAHGINRSRIITNVYMNRARTSDVPFPPDSWLYNGGAAQYDYNTQTSNALLDDLGYVRSSEGYRMRNGESITLTLLTSSTTENTTRSDAAELIAAQLGEIGITVNIVTAAHGYGETQSELMLALAAGEWDIALIGFNLSRSGNLATYLLSEGGSNIGSYSNPSMGALVNAMAAAYTEEALREQAYALQTNFTEELPFIVLYFRLNSVVCTAELNGTDGMREPALMRNIKNWYFTTK